MNAGEGAAPWQLGGNAPLGLGQAQRDTSGVPEILMGILFSSRLQHFIKSPALFPACLRVSIAWISNIIWYFQIGILGFIL